MTTTKLTPEDVAWLERQLSHAIRPIEPRREFVDRARAQLRDVEPVHPLPHWVKGSVLAAMVLSLLALVAMLLYLRNHEP